MSDSNEGGSRCERPQYCYWLWNTITVLCDGTVTCGLDDPHGARCFGNVGRSSISDIFRSDAVDERRLRLLSGWRCSGCDLHTEVGPELFHALAPSSPHPKHAVIEFTIRCNIRCRNDICAHNNDPKARTRKRDFLSFEDYSSVLDEIGPSLQELFLFNYGEPFVHPRAMEFLRYARMANSSMRISTSTNGTLLSEVAADKIVKFALLDEICFTISGSDVDTYRKYHVGGDFNAAVTGMRAVVEAKHRHRRRKPLVKWRYLLFSWNDSDAQLDAARQLAREIGVDVLRFFLVSDPLTARSTLRAPASPGFALIRDAVEFEYHYRVGRYADHGLYEPETSPILGRFAWTSARARVEVPIQEGQACLRLAAFPRPNGGLPVVVLATPWSATDGRVGSGIWEDNVIAIPSDFADSSVPVEVCLAKTWRPNLTNHGGDSRELGVMVSLATVTVP